MFVSRVLAAILASIGRKKFRLTGKRAGSTAFPDSGTATKEPIVSRLRLGAYGGNAFRSAMRLDRVRIDRTRDLGSIDPVNPVTINSGRQIHAVDGIAVGNSNRPGSALVAVDSG